MKIKDNLKLIKGKLLNIKNNEKSNIEKSSNIINNTKEGLKRIVNHPISKDSESILLDERVNAFINWYYKNMIKGNYTDVGERIMPNEMRNFIEKVAVWYELRYPNYEVNKIMPCLELNEHNVNDNMFINNQYVKNILDNDLEIKDLDWIEFYNAKAFINSLSNEERYLFAKPKYPDIVYYSKNHSAHLHLYSNGIVEEAENIYFGDIRDKDLKGKHIKDVVKLFKDKNVSLADDNGFEKAIKDYENNKYQKEEMLNCVMYRIMERGGRLFGPRRAYLFAKEFKRNLDIPLIYGIDRFDSRLREFINQYIKDGGHKDLECYVGYFNRSFKHEKLPTITIQELIRNHRNNVAKFYTPEENELHQRLVNALANNISQEELEKVKIKERKEEVQKLRLERKLEKSKRQN